MKTSCAPLARRLPDAGDPRWLPGARHPAVQGPTRAHGGRRRAAARAPWRANGSARRQEALLLGVDDVVHGDREICHAARHGAGRRGPERAALARMVRGGSATTNAMRKEWGRKPPRNKQRTVTQCCHQRCTCGITSREGLAAGAGVVVRGAAVAAAAAAAAVGAAAAGASGRWPPETSTRPGTPSACAIHLRLAMQHLVIRVPRCLPRHLNCTCAELRRTVDAPAPGYLAG